MSETETLRAERNGKYYLRFLVMGIAALGFGAYCIYDGYITWPAEQVRYEEYAKFKEREEEGDKQAMTDWIAFAAEKGWRNAPPKERSPSDIAGQYLMAGICGVLALGFLIFNFSSLGRWLEADDKAITTSWGETIPYDQVTAVDKRRWKNKGIAKIRYSDNGSAKTFVLDDFKFVRPPTDAMLYRLEQAIDQSLITGGKPEKSPEQQAAEKAAKEEAMAARAKARAEERAEAEAKKNA